MAARDIDLLKIKNRYHIVGNSPELDMAIRTALSVATTNLPVLIIGESGVGKDVFSQMIHDYSKRKSRKLLPVNCGAIPVGTVNSELFGHERGSFTGAVESRKGWFEEADGSTIFLDEIGELPKDTQAQLLRVLQQGEFMRVGSSKVLHTDVRVVAATNLDLNHAISQGKFRLDLYYRLNTITVKIPALRERPDDIPLLFRQFCIDFAVKNNYQSVSLTKEAENLLKSYRWPGNVRELISIANRVCTMESEPLSPGVSEERVQITSQQLNRHMPHDEGSFIPAVAEETGSGLSPEERKMIFGSIVKLKQEVEELKKTVIALQGGQKTPDAAFALAPRRDESYMAVEEPEPDEQSQEEIDTEARKTGENALTLEDNTYQAILSSMARNDNNRSKVARELGISERTVYRKLNTMMKLGLWQKD